MAIEPKRGCGYRKVHGLYLVGRGPLEGCDRLPINLEPCPVCGQGIKFTRGITRIQPYKLWGNHQGCDEDTACNVCRPPTSTSFLMWVGGKWYTPNNFMEEMFLMGASKRIAAVPKDLKIGKTVIYLAHLEATNLGQDPITGEDKLVAGVFSSFTPDAVEILIWRSEATPEKIKELTDRGLTVIVVPDGDSDHAPQRKKRATEEEDEGEGEGDEEE